MHFASPIPWWLAVIVAAGIVGIALYSYRRTVVPLRPRQRGLLVALRVLAFGSVVLFLCRPVVMTAPSDTQRAVVPVLVDVSRSMQIADADGQPRIASATQVYQSSLLPALSREFTPELHTFGEQLVPGAVEHLRADARQTDLLGALAAVRAQYRGRRVAGIVVLSDGGDTGQRATPDSEVGPPVFTVGVGSPQGVTDREVVAVAAGDPRLDQMSVDLRVSAVSHGFGRAPFDVRLLANGRIVDTRAVTPAVDGSPIEEVFTVSPDPLTPTVYTAEIVADAAERIRENNTRSVLVSPAGRKRRVLTLIGAPGFEHSFLTRALSDDSGLEVDTVVRKGKNESGDDTFFVQAGGGRAANLTAGFPSRREALYVYDAVVIANLEADFFTREQLSQTSDFVAARGGGLLVLGGRSFVARGLIGTPLEEVLPVELNDRRGGLARVNFDARPAGSPNTVTVTAEGERHPVMRLAAAGGDLRKLWAGLPALAATAALGAPKPGATVLAVSAAPNGGVYPLIAVQRFGSGRSMVFAGEASWRWRMMRPSTDRTYDLFWRQAARWLAAPAPDPVGVDAPEAAEPGDAVEIGIDARDAAFAAVPEAVVEVTLTAPGGETRPLVVRRTPQPGRFVSAIRLDRAGLYRVRAEARRGGAALGIGERWFHVGGSDREFADPRLNESLLRRIARSSGGRYAHASDGASLMTTLTAVRALHAQAAQPEPRDLWHGPGAFGLVIALLAAEWVLRRRWGLR